MYGPLAFDKWLAQNRWWIWYIEEGTIVFLPLTASPIVILTLIFQLCDFTPVFSK
jgi:hypothetical protein